MFFSLQAFSPALHSTTEFFVFQQSLRRPEFPGRNVVFNKTTAGRRRTLLLNVFSCWAVTSSIPLILSTSTILFKNEYMYCAGAEGEEMMTTRWLVAGAPRPPMTDVGTETAFRFNQGKHFRKSKHLLRSEVNWCDLHLRRSTWHCTSEWIDQHA